MNWRGRLGIRVDRANAEYAPAIGVTNLFTIAGGQVMIVELYGVIVVVCGGVATNTSLEANPTTGTIEVLCAVLDTANYAVDDMLCITGNFADAMLPAATSGVVPGLTHPFILTIGTLDLRTAAINTGEISWHLAYIPLDVGAYVVAA